MNLLEQTKKLLKEKPPGLTLFKIAVDCDLSYSWVCKLSGGSLDNPSYLKLQALHDYLVTHTK